MYMPALLTSYIIFRSLSIHCELYIEQYIQAFCCSMEIHSKITHRSEESVTSFA